MFRKTLADRSATLLALSGRIAIFGALVAGPVGTALAGAALERPVSSDDATDHPQGKVVGIAGRVVGPSGQPIPDALVDVSPVSRDAGPVPDLAVMTDARGRFVWNLAPGTYRLRILLQGREIARKTVRVTADRATATTIVAPAAR